MTTSSHASCRHKYIFFFLGLRYQPHITAPVKRRSKSLSRLYLLCAHARWHWPSESTRAIIGLECSESFSCPSSTHHHHRSTPTVSNWTLIIIIITFSRLATSLPIVRWVSSGVSISDHTWTIFLSFPLDATAGDVNTIMSIRARIHIIIYVYIEKRNFRYWTPLMRLW